MFQTTNHSRCPTDFNIWMLAGNQSLAGCPLRDRRHKCLAPSWQILRGSRDGKTTKIQRRCTTEGLASHKMSYILHRNVMFGYFWLFLAKPFRVFFLPFSDCTKYVDTTHSVVAYWYHGITWPLVLVMFSLAKLCSITIFHEFFHLKPPGFPHFSCWHHFAWLLSRPNKLTHACNCWLTPGIYESCSFKHSLEASNWVC